MRCWFCWNANEICGDIRRKIFCRKLFYVTLHIFCLFCMFYKFPSLLGKQRIFYKKKMKVKLCFPLSPFFKNECKKLKKCIIFWIWFDFLESHFVSVYPLCPLLIVELNTEKSQDCLN